MTDTQPDTPPSQDPLKDIAPEAHWTASSCAPDHPVSNVFDKNSKTYWQSDAPLPHYLYAEYNRSVRLSSISFLLCASGDDTYAPNGVAVYVGTSKMDLMLAAKFKLQQDDGYVHKSLDQVTCMVLCIVIEYNHHNGKDSRLRRVRLWETDPSTRLLQELR